MGLKPCAAALFATALGGCGTVMQTVGDPYVEPGKYQFLRCEDIGREIATTETRGRQLHALMERSGTGAGGTTVNWLVYQPDLQTAEASLRLLKQTAAEKKCSPEVLKAAAAKADLTKTDSGRNDINRNDASRNDIGPLH